jgi:hypothetical protein
MPLETGGYAYAAHGYLRRLIPLSQDHVIVVRSRITDGGVDSWDEVAFDIAAKLGTS